jgi:TetR/AcrR family transcriptional repressor of nem operon
MIVIRYRVKQEHAMKVSRDQVAEHRQRILEAAARLFRERGFEGVTVAEIMKAAGLTHGAFYGHFGSKEDLIAQAFAFVLGETASREARSLTDYAATYLTAGHRDSPGKACLFATLGTEAVRASPEVRRAMTIAIRRQIESLSRTAPGKTSAARRRAAIGSWSAMVGALILARLADDPALSDELLEETRAWLGA